MKFIWEQLQIIDIIFLGESSHPKKHISTSSKWWERTPPPTFRGWLFLPQFAHLCKRFHQIRFKVKCFLPKGRNVNLIRNKSHIASDECLRNQFNMQTNVQKPLGNNRNHVTSWNLSTSKGTRLINVNSFDEPLHCNEWRTQLPAKNM